MSGLRPTCKKVAKKRSPVTSSTSGYCSEILLLHAPHLPPRKIKLKTGINSYQ